jgi:hypothetical protein
MAVDTRIHYILIFMSFVTVTDVTVVSRQFWGELGTNSHKQGKFFERITRSIKRSTRLAVDVAHENTEDYSTRWNTSYEIMQSPSMNAAFAAHVEKCVLSTVITLYTYMLSCGTHHSNAQIM